MERLFALAIVLVVLPIWGQDSELFQQALVEQRAGRYEQAADLYRGFLRNKPGYVAAHSNLGVVLVQLGRFDEAIAEYETANRLLPDDPRIEVNLALAYSKSGRFSEEAQILEALHKNDSESKQITLLLADCHLQMGNDARVVELLSRYANEPDLSISYLLGTALIREKRTREGEALIDRILKDGDPGEARFLLGMKMFEAGDLPAAVKQLASAIEAKSDLPGVYAYYARALLLTGDASGAEAALQKELDRDPANYLANLSLGQILSARKQDSRALPMLEKAARARPNAGEARDSLGQALARLKQWDKARGELEAAEHAGWESVPLHENLAQVYQALGLAKDAKREQTLGERLNAADTGGVLKVGDSAPDFDLRFAGSEERRRLSDEHGKRPVVLVFGSYSCPNFRDASGALQKMYDAYANKAAFLLIYIREAHAKGSWQSGRNERQEITAMEAASVPERQAHATQCLRTLHLKFRAAVDDLEGTTEKAYAAWPSRTVIVGKDGKVVYNSALLEQDFRATEMERALREALR
jgi:tetratricopeptide (TPR) repeat protein